MELANQIELANTKAKLRRLEALYEKEQADISGSDAVRVLSLNSVKQMIDQLSEEIARYELRHPAPGVGLRSGS